MRIAVLLSAALGLVATAAGAKTIQGRIGAVVVKGSEVTVQLTHVEHAKACPSGFTGTKYTYEKALGEGDPEGRTVELEVDGCAFSSIKSANTGKPSRRAR